jgi:hypothetical protein
VNDSIAAERAAARYIAGLALAVLAVLLGWFAYIDAPITDGVMLLVACAVAAGVVAVLASLWGYAAALAATGADADSRLPPRVRRLRRVAMAAAAVMLVVAAVAMVATLNVRGDDSDSGGDATTGSV